MASKTSWKEFLFGRGYRIQNLRRLSQVLFILFFFWLVINTQFDRYSFDYADQLKTRGRFFFNIDPLVFVATSIAARTVIWSLAAGAVTLLLTLVFGRIFCGWICPLGTLNQFVGYLRRRATKPAQRPRDLHRTGHRLKYYILTGLLISSIFGLQLVGWMDPISLTVRSMTTSVLPGLQYGLSSLLDSGLLLNWGWLSSGIEPVYRLAENNLFFFEMPHFRGSLFIGILFLLILGMNLYETRFWCRYLCPAGALMGFFSKFQIFRLEMKEGSCSSCKLCTVDCEGAADPLVKDGWRASECLMCWNCIPVCPSSGLEFKLPRLKPRMEPGMMADRRRLLGSAALGFIAVPMMRVNFDSKRVHPKLVRPPGSLPEKEFLGRCIACDLCLKACPTSFLQPALHEAGLEGLWSPVGIGRKGYCQWDCTVCGQVCPTHAIEELELTVKQKVKIGLAFVDRSRCLPFALDKPCIVCEEHCPTPKKAIWLEDITVTRPDGTSVDLRRPHVDPDLCIGCAICENVCPIVDKPAIFVTSVGESRSKDNQMILPDQGFNYGSDIPADPYVNGSSDPYSK
jgi:polyferredoxin/formate hydrogenlyase subunit 6/NADH:ubiquinone oxidoreductase subunit I